MQRRNLVALAATAIAAAAALLPAAASAHATAPHYYLALGDSLSQGMQPDLNGVTRDTNQGYANDLLTIEQRRVRNLQLVQLGCGGETTTSMLTGHGNKDAAEFHCHPAGGSQLAAAVRFLKAHHNKGEVPLITVDIGANDIVPCVSAPNLIQCVTDGLNSISTNVPKIFAALKQAAPKGTTFAAMNLYDPILAGYLAPAGTTAHSLALASVSLSQEVNAALAQADQTGGVLTADVADAFATYDNTTMVTWEGQQIPLNVANICSYTWNCTPPPSGPNIHANKNGYQVIANTFAKVIGNRL